jgi:hypothetical protein
MAVDRSHGVPRLLNCTSVRAESQFGLPRGGTSVLGWGRMVNDATYFGNKQMGESDPASVFPPFPLRPIAGFLPLK